MSTEEPAFGVCIGFALGIHLATRLGCHSGLILVSVKLNLILYICQFPLSTMSLQVHTWYVFELGILIVSVELPLDSAYGPPCPGEVRIIPSSIVKHRARTCPTYAQRPYL